MQQAWMTSLIVACCAVGLVVDTAAGGPASMVSGSGSAASAKPFSLPSVPLPSIALPTLPSFAGALPTLPSFKPAGLPLVDRPTAHISPMKNPVKYFAAAMSELPVPKGLHLSSKPSTFTAQRSNVVSQDALALSTPTGPASPELHLAIAKLAEQQGNIAAARQSLQTGLSMWPGNVELLRGAARMEDRQGHLPLAENLYRQAVASDPQNAGALNDLGLCLARQGKLQESAQTIEQAVHLQPDRALYRNNVATVLVELKQDQKALAHLAAVHGPAEANFNLGQLLVQRGRAGEAVAYFHTALQYRPELSEAQEAIARQPKIEPATQPVAVSAAPSTPVSLPQMVGPQAAPESGYAASARYPATGGGEYEAPSGPSLGGAYSMGYREQSLRHLPPVSSQPSRQ